MLDGSEERKWHVEMLGVVYGKASSPWDDNLAMIGTSTEPESSVRLTLTKSRRRHSDDRVSAQSLGSTLRVRIEGAADDVLTPVEVPELDHAIGMWLSPSLHRRGARSASKPTLMVDVTTGCSRTPEPPTGFCGVLAANPSVTFAARFEVLHRDEVVGTARAWWRFDGQRAAPTNSEVMVGELATDLLERDINDGQWSLRVVSDPETALRDLGSSRYWEGEVMVALRVTDSRN
jgi:hypothetical protein